MSLPKKNLKRRLVDWVDDKKQLFQDEVKLAGRHKFLHFFYLILRNFDDNRCLSRAGAMTFSTILAIVPTLAIVIAITPLFTSENEIRQTLIAAIEYFAPTLEVQVDTPDDNPGPDNTGTSTNEVQEVNIESVENTSTNIVSSVKDPNSPQEGKINMKEQIVDGIMEFTGNFKGTKLTLFGFVAIIGMVFSSLITIESVMNDIWDTEKGRPWPARLMSYWVVISVSGVMLFLSTGLLTFQKKINEQVPGGAYVSAFGIIIFIALALTVLYRLMPNAKVKWLPALIGGVTAASLIQLNKMVIPWIISGRAERDSQIYGSFVAVTLFMFGAYIAWVIVLFGAQVAATFQNRRSYLHQIQSKSIHQYGRETTAFKIMTLAGKAFVDGNPPPTFDDLTKTTKIPEPLVLETVEILIFHDLLRTVGEGKAKSIVPARPVEQITCFDILNAMRCSKGQNLEAALPQPVKEFSGLKQLLSQLDEFRSADKSNTQKMSLKELLDSMSTSAA